METFDDREAVWDDICRLSKLEKLDRAKTVLKTMREKGKACVLVEFMVKDGTFDDCEMVWDDIFKDGLRIDVSDYVVYACKYGGGCDVKRVCERLLLGCLVLRKDGYDSLVGALSRANKGVLAKRVVQEMEDKGVEMEDFIYLDLFRCFCRNGDLGEADSVLRKLVRRKCHIGVSVYSDFLYALCKRGKVREADKLFRKMVANDCSTIYKNEFLKEGKRVIFQLKFEDVVPEITVYGTYFKSLCRVGKLNEAEALLKKNDEKTIRS